MPRTVVLRTLSGFLLLTLGLGAPAAALPSALQASAAAAPIPCQTAQQYLLQVHVGGADRGVQLAYQTPDGLWLAATTFLPSEGGYAAAQGECDGEALVLLRPEVQFVLDPRQLTLRIEPNAALLPRTTLWVDTSPANLGSDLPMVRLRYDARGGVNVLQAGSASAQTQLELEYWRGPVQLGVAHAQVYRGGELTQWFGANADWHLSPTASAGMFWRGGPETVFGVRGTVNGYASRELPVVEITLAADAEVEVLLDNITVRTFRAPAGTVRLEGLRPQGPRGTIELRWQEGEISRSVVRPYNLSSLYRSGSYQVRGEAGWAPGRGLVLDGAASVLLDPNIRLQAAVRHVGAQGRSEVSATYTRQQFSVGAGTSLNWDGERLDATAQVRFGVALPQGHLGLTGTYAPASAALSGIGLSGSLFRGPWSVLGQVGYQLDHSVSGRASVSYHPTSRGTTTLFGEVRNGRYAVGLSGQYVLSRNSKLDVVASPTAPSRVTYSTWLGDDLFRVSYDTGQGASASYSFNRDIDGQLAVQSSGQISGHVNGSLVWIGGELSSAANREGAVLQLKTGVPGLRVTAAGRTATADAQGDLVLSGLPTLASIQLRVDLNDLPIEIGLRSSSVNVTLRATGVQTYDWSANFVRSQWWTLRWSEKEPAAFAVLSAPGGQDFYADEEGRVLLPPLPPTAELTLRTEDGTRRCGVTAAPAPGVLICAD